LTSERNKPLLSFYGDDFTGSADAMEALSLNGVRAALFLAPPSPEELRGRFANLQAVGVAGVSRTMMPAQMGEALPEIFGKIKELGAPVFHYKVCSTFDSSPEVGSIGRAIEIGQRIFDSQFVPLVVGAPPLGRYCLFGNLFARVGDTTFRIDRHPTMSRHPVTPMNEGDLRIHLSKQTKMRTVSFDILQLTGTPAEVDRRFDDFLADSRNDSGKDEPIIILFDVLDDARLAETGRLIWTRRGQKPSFVAGSSGVEYAFAAHWREAGVIPGDCAPGVSPGAVEQIIVVSGSCSPVTGRQIEWALTHGFSGIELNTAKLADAEHASGEREAALRKSLAALAAGRSIILHTAMGPDDPRIALAEHKSGERPLGERLGEQLGLMLRTLLEATGLRRAVVAGGDTAGFTTRQLGIYALELLTPIAPGSPLCHASSHHAALDGLEIALKGGQGGEEDYFECIQRGTA
jgi:uncharacterized protein YgbK (DUF1537 family)